MEHLTNALDLLSQPGLLIRNNVICYANAAAQGMLLREGESILTLLADTLPEFQEGAAYLQLQLGNQRIPASLTRLPQGDVLVVETRQEQLQAMALVSRELRGILEPLLNAADQLFSRISTSDPEAQAQMALMNKQLFQLLRMAGNLSMNGSAAAQLETVSLTAFLEELLDKARQLLEQAGHSLSFTNEAGTVFLEADSQLLERAILNILANAAKFTPRCHLEVTLRRSGDRVSLVFADNGPGIPSEVYPTLFRRYLRQPGLEDSRYGLGLGMALIRAAAAAHAGTVLITPGSQGGTRVILTLSARTSTDTQLRSPVLRMDYAGGRDHQLVELSGVLPKEVFRAEEIN
mgnify:CR=1 FL=1